MELASERVIIEAPMSFTGSAKRIWRFFAHQADRAAITWPPKWYSYPTLFLIWGFFGLILTMTWVIVLLWYLTFGLLLTPYRLIRRSSRKQKRDALRHRETMEAIAHK